jgi:hypothetical protein
MSEPSKSFFANNWFKLFIVALSLFLIALYFIRESKLDDCLEFTHESYKNNWAFQCKQGKQDPECSLPRMVAEGIEKDRDRQANECFRRYSFR